jgi:gamma-glutamylcyclotransferase (GGCT)/AIG2-like uncharacterized protein YtfP
VLYFAYGSNMLRERLHARVGRALHLGRAHLPGYHLAFAKRSRDGSGKCTLFTQPRGAGVWGVVFALTPRQKGVLDEYEGVDYTAESVILNSPRGRLRAYTYIGTRRSIDHSLQPYAWYRDLVLAGAVQAGLPDHHIAKIESVPVCSDGDPARASENLSLITASR